MATQAKRDTTMPCGWCAPNDWALNVYKQMQLSQNSNKQKSHGTAQRPPDHQCYCKGFPAGSPVPRFKTITNIDAAAGQRTQEQNHTQAPHNDQHHLQHTTQTKHHPTPNCIKQVGRSVRACIYKLLDNELSHHCSRVPPLSKAAELSLRTHSPIVPLITPAHHIAPYPKL